MITDTQQCPICGDIMTEAHSNFVPVWSEHYDNIVCIDCAETMKDNTNE